MIRENFRFDQIHIDIARNSTDDFNPFHDPQRCGKIRGNPFPSTIALGFQLECLVADRVQAHRKLHDGPNQGGANKWPYSNYEFRFADALPAGVAFDLEIKNTIDAASNDGGISNRIVVRNPVDERMILIGSQSETPSPRFLNDESLDILRSLRRLPRGSVTSGNYFAKRKFLNTSNGKNFVVGSLCNQFDYFDELSERVYFPPLFPVSLISSALLEKGWNEGHDFASNPMVYTSHQISVDNRMQRELRSNDMLHIVVEGPLSAPRSKGLAQASVEQTLYRCFGVLEGHEILFRANVALASLQSLLQEP